MMALCATTSDSEPAPKTKRPEQQAGLARSQPVDEHAAEEHDEDGRERVGRVQHPDGLPLEVQRFHQRDLERGDAVVGEVAPEGQQADEQQDAEAIAERGWMKGATLLRRGDR
jgi:hypothetical protein